MGSIHDNDEDGGARTIFFFGPFSTAITTLSIQQKRNTIGETVLEVLLHRAHVHT